MLPQQFGSSTIYTNIPSISLPHNNFGICTALKQPICESRGTLWSSMSNTVLITRF